MSDERETFQNIGRECSNDSDNLERLGSIGYDVFYKDYLLKNRLCIFSSEVTKNWKSRHEWVKDGKPNYEFLERNFGNAITPVADCSKTYCSSHPKVDMKLTDYLKCLKSRDDQDTKCLYLKDWHFCKVFPEYKAYETPVFFKSDWLNEYWDQCSEMEDDYRFVYIGPKGSWTPFHADVFRSYSWSANICGCKKWIIYPPGQEEYLHDTLGNLIYDVTSSEIANNKKYPKIDHIQKPIVVIQKEGEVLFVPSGWHHQVHNMEDTISINHNWTNACGLFKMWNHLQSELNQVQRSIQDCNDMENWHQHCQLMLKAMSGMDYEGFVSFLVKIAQPRCDVIATNYSTSETEKWLDVFYDWEKTIKQVESKEEFNVKDYCIFDLATIHKCVAMVANDSSLQKLQNASINGKIDELLSQIMNVLGDNAEMWGPLASLRFEDKFK